jgi:hypothetical protein
VHDDDYCTPGCKRLDDNDCDCSVDMDCIDTSNAYTSGICKEDNNYMCYMKTVPELIDIQGDLQGF